MKKGDKVVMLFHGFGYVSEEEHIILSVSRDGTVILDTDENPKKCFRFDQKSGKCLNDVTDFGCYRTLKLGKDR